MKAIEKRGEVIAAASQLRRSFGAGATPLAGMGGTVHWHESFGVWGLFGETTGRGGATRDWNAFGQRPHNFRSNIIVEINPPRRGVDLNLQGAFAIDSAGERWLLHQGRLSVPKRRITEADFIKATGLKPVEVRFSEGMHAAFHKVAPIDAPPPVLQESIAAFVAKCARARIATDAPPDILAALNAAQKWERGLKPETTGSFTLGPRDPVKVRRRHAEVWRELAAELARRKVPHSNDRVAQYGPDLFTFGDRNVLFEIKSFANSHDVFEGVGQLHIYERLLGCAYRKVLVLPGGMGRALSAPLRDLDVTVLEYERRGRRIEFDKTVLAACLGA